MVEFAIRQTGRGWRLPDLAIRGAVPHDGCVESYCAEIYKPAGECVVITPGHESNVFLPTQVANELLANSDNCAKFEGSVKSRSEFFILGPTALE